MKAEIQKVLEMNKAGTLTDEQATALLEELARREKPEDLDPRKEFKSAPGSGNPISDFIQNTIHHAFGSPAAGDTEGNQVQMSRLDPPTGRDFVFSHNTIAVSSVTRVELNNSEMSHNSVNASKLERVALACGTWLGSSMNGSSMDRIEIRESKVEGLHVNGCKLSRLTVMGESQLQDSRFEASKISRLVLEDSKLEAVKIHALKFEQVEVIASTLSRVEFSDGGSWRWQGIAKTRFENCFFENVRFLACRMKNTVIRNVTLKSLDIRDADLSGQTIDGNEAFLRATGLKSGEAAS